MGERVRQRDMAFPLAGKTKGGGGQLVVKIVFKITEDGGASCQRRPAFFHCKFCQRRMYSILLLSKK
jgi:hypothetical protein